MAECQSQAHGVQARGRVRRRPRKSASCFTAHALRAFSEGMERGIAAKRRGAILCFCRLRVSQRTNTLSELPQQHHRRCVASAPLGQVEGAKGVVHSLRGFWQARGWKAVDSDSEWDFHWADTTWVRDNMDQVVA